MRWLTIGGWLSLGGVLLLLVGPLATRLGVWNFLVGFALMALGGLSILLAVLALLAGGYRTGEWMRALPLVVGGVAVLAVPIVLVVRSGGAPPIHDITTDTSDPPRFVSALPLRAAANAANPPEYGGPEVAAQQQRAFPDLQPLVITMPPQQVFERVLKQVAEFGWQVTGSEPAEGRIEAVDTTFFFGFKDDVVVRLRPVEGGTRVDVRSKSRVGVGDLGANAARIRRLLEALRGAAPR
jgi:uncharacterized protein (DUF1499 family)